MCKVTVSAYEFLKRFPDAQMAQKYIEQQRWNGSPSCPTCRAVERIQTRKIEGYYRCLACKLDFTVRTGTIFERSHVPLDKWLFAIYLVVTSRKGISSLQLSKELGVTQKTAWFMLQRIREACGNDNDDDDSNGFLKGIVEADETYIGGKETNKHASKKLKAGRGTTGKIGVLGFKERAGNLNACENAAFEASHVCKMINVDGGEMKICAALDDVSVKCLKYSKAKSGLRPYGSDIHPTEPSS